MDYADKIEADSWARRADWQLSEGRGRGLGEKGEGIKQRKKKIRHTQQCGESRGKGAVGQVDESEVG